MKKITAMNILEILTLVATGEGFPEIIEPLGKVDGSEQGVADSETTKRLHTVYVVLKQHAEDLENEHRAFHECPATRPGTHDCVEFCRRLKALVDKANAIGRLMWQEIYESHPMTRANQFSLKKGWRLVSNTEELMTPPDLPRMLIKNVASNCLAIFTGKVWPNSDIKMGGPVKDTDRLISKIEDERIRSIFGFIVSLSNEGCEDLPAEFPRPSSGKRPDLKQLKDWAEKQSYGYIKSLEKRTAVYQMALNDLGDLFQVAIRETIPAINQEPFSVIREGWNLVRPEEDESEVEPVSDPVLARIIIPMN